MTTKRRRRGKGSGELGRLTRVENVRARMLLGRLDDHINALRDIALRARRARFELLRL